MGLLAHAVQQLAAAGQALLLHGQHIHRHDDAHQEVHGEAHQPPDAGDHAAGDGGEHLLGAGQHLVGQQVQQILVIGLQILVDPVLHLGVLIQQVRDPAVNLVVIRFGVVDEHHHAVDELGDHHAEHQIQQQQHNGPGQQNADGPQPPGGVGDGLPFQPLDPVQARKNELFKPVDDGGQQIGHHQAHQHRRQNGRQLGQQPLQCAAHIERVVKHQNGADGEKDRQTPFQVAALTLHIVFSFVGPVGPDLLLYMIA